MIADGHEVAYLVPSQTGSPVMGIKNGNGVKMYELKSVPWPFYADVHVALPFQNNLIKNIFNDFKPDIIHVQTNLNLARAVLSVAKEQNIPIVCTNHFMSENVFPKLPFPDFFENWLDVIMWRNLNVFFSKFDALTSPSHWGAGYLKNKGVKRDVHVISNGIDLTVFSSKNKNEEYIGKKYKIPKAEFYLLYVGRIDKEKNIDIILKAMKLLNKKHDICLVVAGKGTELVRLKALSRKIGMDEHIILTGFVPDEDLRSLYKFSDAFIISSIAELQSIVTLEAMASGLPVLAANAGALPELVKNNVNGHLFNPLDVHEIAKAIDDLFSTKKNIEREGQESIKTANTHDIKKSAKKFEDLYLTVIKENH